MIAPGERSEVGEVLKVYHTESRLTLRTPHAKRIIIENRMALWMTSNSTAAVRLDPKADRRYTVFIIPADALTADYRAMIDGLFDKERQQMTDAARGELAAFAHALATRKVDWERARRPLLNDARRELAEASRSALDTFLDEVAESDGAIVAEWIARFIDALPDDARASLQPFDFGDKGVTVKVVYSAFRLFARDAGLRGHQLELNRFDAARKARFGERWKRTRLGTGPRPWVFAGLRGLGKRTMLQGDTYEREEPTLSNGGLHP